MEALPQDAFDSLNPLPPALLLYHPHLFQLFRCSRFQRLSVSLLPMPEPLLYYGEQVFEALVYVLRFAFATKPPFILMRDFYHL